MTTKEYTHAVREEMMSGDGIVAQYAEQTVERVTSLQD